MRSATGRNGSRDVSNTDNLQIRGPDGNQIQVVHEWPPRRGEIEERFGELPDTVIFAWDDKIMVPGGRPLDPWLIDHEVVHIGQQRDIGGADVWWDKYLIDDQFRLDQELEAHAAEYRSYCAHHRDRNEQARYLNWVAGRLASKLYGNIIGRGEAMRLIRRGR